MSKVRRFATRTIYDVPLTFENENSERITEKFSVVYKSYSTKAVEELEASLADRKLPDGTIPYSAMLGKMVVSIIDSDGERLTNDEGQPADFGAGFFDFIPLDEVKGIYDRIQDDIFPQKASLAPGPDGLQAAGSEA